MSFFQKLKAGAEDEWLAYTEHPFTEALAEGTLPEAAFKVMSPLTPEAPPGKIALSTVMESPAEGARMLRSLVLRKASSELSR